MASRIFISYRRDDSAGHAGRLADHLHKRFGAARVFLDIDAIQPGTDFPTVLRTSLQETAAMLVVIGPRWTSLADANGVRRLDDADDFVRLEVEAALGRDIPVVPVLVQGAAMPRRDELPASLAPLVTRQAATLDHAEFHDDAERLADRLATALGVEGADDTPLVRRVWPVATVAVLVVASVAGYFVLRPGEGVSTPRDGGTPRPIVNTPAGPEPRVATLLTAAEAQQRRNQYSEALTTLAEARALAPSAPEVRQAQEDVAMEWIRDVRVQNGSSSFGEAIKPALAVIDASLASATGVRRADLLAHSGWATFLMWRDGDRRLNPTDWYRDALKLDPENPYANAMLAHWTTFQDDDVPGAVTLFATALRSGRATEAIRTLQWAAYSNSQTSAANAERVRLADAMRRNGEAMNMRQAQSLWGPYFFALPAGRQDDREVLLAALPPDDHISTLAWAFDEYAKGDEARLRTRRYYVALLHDRAGRVDDARRELRSLVEEMRGDDGSLPNAVRAAMKTLRAR
jgi:hypothetical protein